MESDISSSHVVEKKKKEKLVTETSEHNTINVYLHPSRIIKIVSMGISKLRWIWSSFHTEMSLTWMHKYHIDCGHKQEEEWRRALRTWSLRVRLPLGRRSGNCWWRWRGRRRIWGSRTRWWSLRWRGTPNWSAVGARHTAYQSAGGCVRTYFPLSWKILSSGSK